MISQEEVKNCLIKILSIIKMRNSIIYLKGLFSNQGRVHRKLVNKIPKPTLIKLTKFKEIRKLMITDKESSWKVEIGKASAVNLRR